MDFLADGAKPPLLLLDENLAAVIEKLSSSSVAVLPVVDSSDRLHGVVVLDEVHVAAQAGSAGTWLLAADLMRPNVSPLLPNDRLDRAMELFVEQDLLALPVVNDLKERRVIGLVRRSDLANAYLRHLHGQRSEA